MSDAADGEEPRGADPATYPARIPRVETEEQIREPLSTHVSTHDSPPYWDQMEDAIDGPPPVLAAGPGRAGSQARRRPAPGRMDLLSLRLPPEMIDGVKEIAARKHLPYQTLIRSWIGERLDQEREALRRQAGQSG